MKITAAFILAAVMVPGSSVLLAQDGPGGAILSIAGLNLQVNSSFKAKDDLLAGTEKFAQGASQVTEINLDPSTMGMMGDQYGPHGELTKKLKLMVVHTYSYDKPGIFRMEDVEAYAKKLQDGSWGCPIISREKDRFTYICSKTDGDQTNEMVILTAEPQKLTFIHMAGSMSLNDLSHMSDSARNVGREMTPRFRVRTADPQPAPKATVPNPVPAPPVQ